MSATLAQLRAAHRSLAEQKRSTQAFLNEAHGAISASRRLLERVRASDEQEQPAGVPSAARVADETADPPGEPGA
jgi:hypothetical protein